MFTYATLIRPFSQGGLYAIMLLLIIYRVLPPVVLIPGSLNIIFNKIKMPSSPAFKKMTYLYCINLLKKYFFGVLVATYLLSAAGIPIYLHYCGGELEKVNVVLKSESCCDGEEDDTQTASDCCKDENVFIQNTIDFTFKQGFQGSFIKTCSQLFYLPLPFASIQAEHNPLAFQQLELPPPRLQNSLLISTSVLRI